MYKFRHVLRQLFALALGVGFGMFLMTLIAGTAIVVVNVLFGEDLISFDRFVTGTFEAFTILFTSGYIVGAPWLIYEEAKLAKKHNVTFDQLGRMSTKELKEFWNERGEGRDPNKPWWKRTDQK